MVLLFNLAFRIFDKIFSKQFRHVVTQVKQRHAMKLIIADSVLKLYKWPLNTCWENNLKTAALYKYWLTIQCNGNYCNYTWLIEYIDLRY